jgi:catechol 2,3-dioxygenase-like lactoylglutathione lyase family enzyme
MIRGLDFVSIPVRDLDRAMAFYRDTLGLRLLSHTEGKWAELELPDGNAICLFPPESYGMPFNPVMSLSLGTADVAMAAETLASRGVTLPKGTKPHDSGACLGVAFQDPEGNTLHLHHRYAPEG